MKQPNIVIVDYGVGNTQSVWNAVYALGYRKLRISCVAEDVLGADALILPGVGAFAACASNLRDRQLKPILNEAVLVRKKAILGICVGMQLMATASEENGEHEGLNWIPGRVVKLQPPRNYAVPHVGWNNIERRCDDALFDRLPEAPNFYFDHGYHYQCEDRFITADCDYGMRVTAAIRWNNIRGVQFHPEKSQNNGLKVFRSFLNSISS